jgi:hypothetical protein
MKKSNVMYVFVFYWGGSKYAPFLTFTNSSPSNDERMSEEMITYKTKEAH